jgi:hypothetical protein
MEYKSRFFPAIALVIIEIGCMISYGIDGFYYQEGTTPIPASPYQRAELYPFQPYSVILLAVFVLVGFGMVLSYYRFAHWLGMATAILVVALSVQLAPLIQKFWFSVFITSFGRLNPPEVPMGRNIQ